MNFCTNCGSKTEAGKFCIHCGASPPSPAAQATTPPITPLAPAAPATGGTWAKGIAAALSALIITSMLLGWLSIHIDISPRGMMGVLIGEVVPREVMWTLENDLRYNMTIYELNSFARSFEASIDLMESIMRHDPLLGPSAIAEFRMMTEPLSVIPTAVGIIRTAITLGILALAAYLLLLGAKSRLAVLVGRLVHLLTTLTALGFIIAMARLNSAISDMMGLAGAEAGIDFVGITVGASVWVWLTLILSVMGFIVTIVQKSAIKRRG